MFATIKDELANESSAILAWPVYFMNSMHFQVVFEVRRRVCNPLKANG